MRIRDKNPESKIICVKGACFPVSSIDFLYSSSEKESGISLARKASDTSSSGRTSFLVDMPLQDLVRKVYYFDPMNPNAFTDLTRRGPESGEARVERSFAEWTGDSLITLLNEEGHKRVMLSSRIRNIEERQRGMSAIVMKRGDSFPVGLRLHELRDKIYACDLKETESEVDLCPVTGPDCLTVFLAGESRRKGATPENPMLIVSGAWSDSDDWVLLNDTCIEQAARVEGKPRDRRRILHFNDSAAPPPMDFLSFERLWLDIEQARFDFHVEEAKAQGHVFVRFNKPR